MSKIHIHNNRVDGIQEVSIRSEIQEPDGDYVATFLQYCDDNPRININCNGGNVKAGMTMIAAMVMFQKAGGIIGTLNEGCADSSAGWVFACGSKGHRKIMQFASIYLHAPSFADGRSIEDFAEGSEEKTMLNRYLNELIDIFVPLVNISRNKIRRMMIEGTTLSADEAVKMGFADEKILVDNIPAIKNVSTRKEICDITNDAKYKIVNSPTSGKTNNKMDIAQLLNLNPEASEGAKAKAITDLVNLAATNKAKIAAKNTELAGKDTEIVNLKAQNKQLNTQVSALKDVEIIDFVDAIIVADPTRKDQREAMINMAKTDFETFKTMSKAVKVLNQIDSDIEDPTQKGETAEKAAKIVLAKEFVAMPMDAREQLKNSNYSKFINLANAYDQVGHEIV